MLQAQNINIPLSNSENLEYLRDSIVTLGTLPQNTGQIDSFGYVTTTYPSFVSENGFATMDQIDALWNNRQYKNKVEINGLVYIPDNQKQFAALRNRKAIAMFQRIRIYKKIYREKTNSQKFWYLFEYMIDNDIPYETFWVHPQVDSLVNWEYPLPETDTIVN